MKALTATIVALFTSVALVAQIRVPQVPIPKDLPLPSIDRLLRGESPITTSLKNARIEVPYLDRMEVKFADMRPLANNSGGFTLKPGHWTTDLDSFCLHPGTRGPQPTDGRGYLSGPLAGRHAAIIEHMLGEYGRFKDIKQHDMQTLIWAILSRSKIHELSIEQQALAARVLTPAQIAEIESGAIDVIPVSLRTRAFDALPREVRAIAEAENRLREILYRANSTYEELERAAVLTGPEPKAARQVPLQRWSIHPNGYLIRYIPHGYAKTTVEIAKPPRYQIRRDAKGRVVSVDFGDGRRTETEYDDSIPAFNPPGNLKAVGYAFKSVKLTRIGRNGRPEEITVRGKGWTFVTKRTTKLASAAPPFGFRLASFQPGDWMERFMEWKERYDEWNEEFGDRAEFYRDIWEHSTHPPPSVEETLRDLEDLEHYRDGIEAALTGDIGDRLGWLIDHQERMNAALERATLVLSGLPDHPEDEGYRPPMDVAIPSSTGSQRLGMGSR